MDAKTIITGVLGSFLPPVQKRLEEQHQQSEAQKAGVREAYMKALFDANTSDAARESIMKALKPVMAPQAYESLARAFPLVQGVANTAAKALAPQGGTQPPQDLNKLPSGLIDRTGTTAPPPTQGQIALPPPEQGPREAMMAPASDAIMPKPGAVLPPAPGPAAGPGAAMLPPPAATAPVAANPMSGYGQYGIDLRQKEAALEDARAIAKARNMIPVKVEEAKAMLPAQLDQMVQSGAIKLSQNADQVAQNIQGAEAIYNSIDPQPLKIIKLAAMGIPVPGIEEVKNIPGAAIANADPNAKDALGGPIDPKTVYTRTKDGKFMPEAAPPKAAPADSPEIRALEEYYVTKGMKPDAAKTKALEEFKKKFDLREQGVQVRIVNAQAAAARAAGTSPAPPGTDEWAADVAGDVVENRLAPSQIKSVVMASSRSNQQAQARLDAINKQIRKLNPKFNFEEAEANYSFSKTPGFQNTVRFSDSVMGSFPLLIKRAKELDNGGIRFANGLRNMVKNQLNDPKLKKFRTDTLLVADEIAKILQGGGTGSGTSDAKLRQAQDIINATDSPQSIIGALEDVSELIGLRRGAYTAGTYMEGTAPHAPKTPGSNVLGTPAAGKPKTADEYLKNLGK